MPDLFFQSFGVRDFDGHSTSKLSHDRYEVYVNGDYVGQKTLLNQIDDITDVNDFLRTHGLSNFKAHLDGDRYDIYAGREGNKIRDALSIYFQNR